MSRVPRDLERYYEAERNAPAGMPPGARERILRGVLDRLPPGPGGGPDDGGGGGEQAAPAAPRGTGASSRAGTLGWSAGSALVGAVAGIAVGVGLAPGGSEPVEEPLVFPASDVAADAGSPAALPAARAAERGPPDAGRAPADDAARASAPARPAAPRVPSSAAEADDSTTPGGSTAEERALVDRARVALRDGRLHQSLVALMEHERRFPDGSLAEERDRLAIDALVAQERTDAALRRIERYLRDHPSGIHRAHVEALRERFRSR